MGTEKNKGAHKPIRLAQRWTDQVPGLAVRIALTMIAIVVVGMMFSALQGIETLWLRLALASAVVLVMLAILFLEGANKGTVDASASRFYVQLKKNGTPLTDHDDKICYHPLKAVAALAAVFTVPLLLAVYLCVTAQPYTYSLQDLPTWLTGSFSTRGDVMGPLGAYTQRSAASIGATGWIRVLVRLLVMNFVNLFPDPLTMTGLIDRLSPLMIASYPAVYLLGYLRGPSLQRKREKENRRAKKVAVRKAQRSSLARELTGEQNAVHYGQRRDSEKPRKKELI